MGRNVSFCSENQIDSFCDKEYFEIMKQDKTDSLTDNDIDKIADLLDNRLAPLATKELVKDEISASESRIKKEIKGYIDEGIETVMEGIDNISKQLAEKEKVERLERWARLAGEKIGVKLET